MSAQPTSSSLPESIRTTARLRAFASLLPAPGRAQRVTHVEELSPRAARVTSWPDWTHPELVAAFARLGIAAPWAHQAQAASLAHSGRHVVVATGTASGKSLAYQLPVLTALLAAPAAVPGR